MQKRILATAAFIIAASFGLFAKGTPVYIDNVSATGITSTSVTIAWTTSLSTSSQVAYGTTANYGSLTALDSTLVSSHSQTISGLTPNTSYHYQVISISSSGTQYIAGDFTFITLPNIVPGMISKVSVSAITDTSATITWTTNTPASSLVQYGPTSNYIYSTQPNPTLETSHSVTVTQLWPLSLWHFSVQSIDAEGNIGISGDNTFTTTGGTASVVISALSVSSITGTSATITWTTNTPANSLVQYGTTSNYNLSTPLYPALVTSHSVILTQLSPLTLYHFSAQSVDAGGNYGTSNDASFTTTAGSVPIVISAVSVSSTTGTSATITWTTNTPASSLVQYGTTSIYNLSTPLYPALVTSHSVTLTQLSPLTLYHFSAQSVDADGNYGTSNDATFTTAAGSVTTPITGVSLFLVTSTSATINWPTTEATSSLVQYGTTSSYGSTTTLDPNLVTSHSVTINQLAPNTLYHCQAVSWDGSGNISESSDFTFTTTALSLFFPQMNLSSGEYTGIGMVNLDQSAGTLNLTAFAGDGTLLNGPNITNPATQTMGPGSQFGLLADQILSSTSPINWPVGWGVFNSADTKLGGFFLTFDSGLTFQDGAPLFANPLDSFVLPESLDQDFTKVILSNPNSGNASVTINLVKADGSLQSSFQTNIQGFATYSADLQSGIFQGVAIAPSDYLNVTSSIPLLPYEAFGNISKDISIVAGQDINAGATTLYAPQYAVGGPENSLLSIVNLDSAPGNVTLKMFGDNGAQMGITQTVPIAANGKIFLADPSFFLGKTPSQLTTGYVQVTSDGVRLSGDVVFVDALHGAFSAALPLVATLLQSQVIGHIASDSTYYTGMALLNPNSMGANVTIQVYTAAGQLDQSTTLTLPAGNRTVQVLTQLFPALAGQARYSGYIKVTSDQPLAAYGAFGTNNLSILSAIPTVPVQ